MFCIECGQELPNHAKFCSRCGSAIQSTFKQPIDNKVEDLAINIDMPNLDNTVIDQLQQFRTHEISSNCQLGDCRTTLTDCTDCGDSQSRIEQRTFFGGELILETVKYSNNDTACYFVDKCPIADRLKSVIQSSNSNFFIIARISDGKKTYLRYDEVEHSLIQDIPEWFDSVEDFQHNFSVVKYGDKYGYVCYNGAKVIWKFDCIFDRATSFAYFTDDTSKQSDILTAKVQIKYLPYFILEDGKVIADKGRFIHKGYIYFFIFINIIFLIIGLSSNSWGIFLADIVYLGWWRWIFRTYSRYEYIKTIQAKK